MADVCILYARADASPLPIALENMLSPDYSVWWDKKIQYGDYREAILHQLRIAGCVIPIWSPASSDSVMVDEVEHARDFGLPLLPLITHPGRPPLGFGRDHMTEAIGWQGELDNSAVLSHVEKVKIEVKRRRRSKDRPPSILQDKKIKPPVFFFSLSSYETKIAPDQGIRALDVLGVKSVLVSARDTAKATSRSEIIRRLRRVKNSGGAILLDSGNYEEGRIASLRQKKNRPFSNIPGTWSIEEYYNALKTTPHDMAFCFDSIARPPNDVNKVVARAVNAVTRDQKKSESPILPIVHLPCSRDGTMMTQLAPEATLRVAKALEVPIVGIPERELGDGIVERMTTMIQIRAALNELCYYQMVHVLGTGDPISIALLSAAGADSFDGLEWCRYVLDSSDARLYPVQDYDFFRWQDELSEFKSNDMIERTENEVLTWLGRLAVHNIEFYLNWMERLRESIVDERKLVGFMTKLLPDGGVDEIWPSLWENST